MIDDPIRLDDPFLDPDGPGARAVLAAALRAPAPHRRRLLPVAAVAAAAAVATVLVALPHAEDPLAAMRQAAARTADAGSGRIVWHLESGGRTQTYDVRFDGRDSATVTDQVTAAGRALHAEMRAVGGHVYVKDGARWTDAGPEPDGMHAAQSAVGDPPAAGDLVALLANAVSADGRTYHAVVPAATLTGRLAPELLELLGSASGQATVDATVDGGQVTALELRLGSALLQIRYLGLGEPQEIAPPSLTPR